MAFGRIINMFYQLKDMGYGTYNTLYHANVMSIANYASGIWGYLDYNNSRMLQNKCNKFYLGTHIFTPTAAVNIEMDEPDIRSLRWVEMVRLKNRFAKMDEYRWPRIVLDWDVETGTNAWAREVKLILTQANCLEDPTLESVSDLDILSRNLLRMSRTSWKMDAHVKTKLELMLEIHDFSQEKVLLKANLPRLQRSLVLMFKAGVFPIRKETGRYKNIKRELRFCEVCEKKVIEDEKHFIFVCKKLKKVRKTYIPAFLKEHKLKWKREWEKCLRVMVQPENIKGFAKWLEQMYLARREIVYR